MPSQQMILFVFVLRFSRTPIQRFTFSLCPAAILTEISTRFLTLVQSPLFSKNCFSSDVFDASHVTSSSSRCGSNFYFKGAGLFSVHYWYYFPRVILYRSSLTDLQHSTSSLFISRRIFFRIFFFCLELVLWSVVETRSFLHSKKHKITNYWIVCGLAFIRLIIPSNILIAVVLITTQWL